MMFWKRDEEETFGPKKEIEEELEVTEIEPEEKKEVSAESINKKLETITQQVNLIAKYLSNISQRVSKAIDASVAYQKDLDDLERRINQLKARLEELENVVPEVELEKVLGKKAA
jgi:polyhydroxyalkanoate synthesis regulator phasin